MKLLPTLLLLAAFLPGCASRVPPATRSLPFSPRPPTLEMTRLDASVNNPVTAPKLLALIYPPDMTNYVWDVQTSTDLVTWTAFEDYTNLSGLPDGTLDVPAREPHRFFRMYGHKL